MSSPKKIVITTHQSPDGDAIGSSLAMLHYLRQKKHQVTVVVPNDYPQFLYWMKGHDEVIVFEKNQTKATEITNDADLIFCLDYNTLSRMKEYGDVVAKTTCDKVLIDHHQEPDSFAKYILSDTSACSTAQLVYDFIGMMNDNHLITKAIAECLYSGIMTDTGNFRFPSTNSHTHKVVADLLDKGADNSHIYNLISDNNSIDKLRLVGYTLAEKLEFFEEYRSALICLSKKELDRFNFKKGDTEGLVNYGLSVNNIVFAAFFSESEGYVKISLRSKGNFDVNKLSREYFNGGGHINAAGGKLDMSIEKAREYFLNLLPKFNVS